MVSKIFTKNKFSRISQLRFIYNINIEITKLTTYLHISSYFYKIESKQSTSDFTTL